MSMVLYVDVMLNICLLEQKCLEWICLSANKGDFCKHLQLTFTLHDKHRLS